MTLVSVLVLILDQLPNSICFDEEELHTVGFALFVRRATQPPALLSDSGVDLRVLFSFDLTRFLWGIRAAARPSLSSVDEARELLPPLVDGVRR